MSDNEFIEAWYDNRCSPSLVSQAIGIDIRNVYHRRTRIQAKGIDALPSVKNASGAPMPAWTFPRVIDIHFPGLKVLIGGDMHVWNPEPPLIWRAFCEVAEREQPDIIILNGDVLDLQSVSRHPRLRDQPVPTVDRELEAARAWLAMLPPTPVFEHPTRLWTLGNHDTRLDSFLANKASELGGWCGGLRDAFPDWTLTYSVMLNDNCEVRHRFRGGVHAAYNNALHSGVSCVTNHTHCLDMKPILDRRGIRYGVQTGMLNDPTAGFMEYGEGTLNQHRSGFALLTFDENGSLLEPELASMHDGVPMFRGRRLLKPRIRVRAGT